MSNDTTTKTTRDRAEQAGAKVPTDRLDEIEAVNGEVTVEHDGFTFTFNPRAISDYKLQKRINRQDPSAVQDMISITLGDNEDAVVEHLADRDGFTDTQAVLEFMRAVQEAAGLGKR